MTGCVAPSRFFITYNDARCRSAPRATKRRIHGQKFKILRSLVARLVWARRRRGPKQPILRMPRAGTTGSAAPHRYPLPRRAARAKPPFLGREAGGRMNSGEPD